MAEPRRRDASGRRSVGEGFRELDERIAYFVKYHHRQNFGDYLPEIICKELLSYPKIDADVFRLIGSVIDERWIRRDLRNSSGHVTGLIAFWGCGAREAVPLSRKLRSHCRFFGVRGARTRDVLGLPEDTVLGDPGLLAPLFHTPRRHPETGGKVIAIPHIQDGRSPAETLALSGADILVHPEIGASEAALRDILDRIASAAFVLTASLHGAIIAAAYGRPFAFWNNGHLDVPFKWEDFASSIGIEAMFAGNAAEGRALYANMAPRIRLPRLAPILQVCPFEARPSALLRALAHDGAGDGAVLLDSARIVDAAMAGQQETLMRLQHESGQNRASRQQAGRSALRVIGFGALRLKRALIR